jgi:ankyrin repeat protein
MTPLHWAVERGHISIVETLLRYGTDVNIESKFGKTALEIASDIGRPGGNVIKLFFSSALMLGSR